MANIKKKNRLDKKVVTVKAPFTMADPNDDAEAYGWSLGKLRYQGKPDPADPGAHWPGEHIFTIPTPLEVRQVYGHSIEFVCPAFVQLMFQQQSNYLQMMLLLQKLHLMQIVLKQQTML